MPERNQLATLLEDFQTDDGFVRFVDWQLQKFGQMNRNLTEYEKTLLKMMHGGKVQLSSLYGFMPRHLCYSPIWEPLSEGKTNPSTWLQLFDKGFIKYNVKDVLMQMDIESACNKSYYTTYDAFPIMEWDPYCMGERIFMVNKPMKPLVPIPIPISAYAHRKLHLAVKWVDYSFKEFGIWQCFPWAKEERDQLIAKKFEELSSKDPMKSIDSGCYTEQSVFRLHVWQKAKEKIMKKENDHENNHSGKKSNRD